MTLKLFSVKNTHFRLQSDKRHMLVFISTVKPEYTSHLNLCQKRTNPAQRVVFMNVCASLDEKRAFILQVSVGR